jgi:hypothetical protein
VTDTRQSSAVKLKFEVNLRPIVSRPVCFDVGHPSGTRDQFFFLLEISFRELRVCYFVTPSLARGRVCNLLVYRSEFLATQRRCIVLPVRYDLN